MSKFTIAFNNNSENK